MGCVYIYGFWGGSVTIEGRRLKKSGVYPNFEKFILKFENTKLIQKTKITFLQKH